VAPAQRLARVVLRRAILVALSTDTRPAGRLQGRVAQPSWTTPQQAADNLRTQLKRFRGSFPVFEHFADEETVIRTSEGARILQDTGAIGI